MSRIALQKIVGKIVISDNFRAGILNGRRAELIGGFDLEPEEYAQVMAIQAQSQEEFAAEIQRITQPHETTFGFDPLDGANAVGGFGALSLSAARFSALR